MSNKRWIVLAMVALAMSVAGNSWADYKTILKHHTKKQQAYSFETFRANLLWAVVYVTPEMRDAFWKRETEITEKPAALESKIITASQVRGTQFLVFMYAPERTETFSMKEDSFWQLKLDKGDSESLPVGIEPIENGAIIHRMIPFTHKWAQVYLVTFSGDFQPPFTLRMVGATAKSNITFK